MSLHPGRHPCTGMKVAKLEIKIILAFMLFGYEFSVVDNIRKISVLLNDA